MADGHTIFFSVVGSVLLVIAIGIMAGVDALWGHDVARRSGALLLAPAIFLITLSLLVQVAKFRRRFDGIQPVIGRLSWAICITVVLAVAIIFAIG